jgi:hypothetical protein
LKIALWIDAVRKADGCRPMVTPANWRSFVAPLLGALAQSPVLSEQERMDRFVAFAVALGLEASDVKEWEEIQKETP